MRLVLFIGLQASGKSSFYRRHLSDHHLVSKDLWPNARNKERRQLRDVRQALENGLSVVVDNTNPSRQDRAGLLALAAELKVPVVGYYFASRLEDCRRRNELRQGKARVPELGLLGTAARLQRPELDEGFTSLYYVTLQEGEFDV